MSDPKSPISFLLRYVTPWLSQALPAWVLLAEDRIVKELVVVDELWKVRTAAVLLSIILLLLTWIYFLRPWLRWDEKTGTWISFFSELRYCEKCRSKKIITPLKDEKTGWRCMVCERWYADPKRRPPEPQATKAVRERI